MVVAKAKYVIGWDEMFRGNLFRIFVVLALAGLFSIIPLTVKRGTGVPLACNSVDLSAAYDPDDKVAVFEGKEVLVPALAINFNRPNVLGAANEERWIEVDLSEQKLRAWEGGSLFLETLVSTGLPWSPTPKGEFRIQYKTRATKMEGGVGRNYYYLPGVPFVMFFGNDSLSWSRGYGLHGTYWHNDFGRQKSHGCVNLPTSVAEKLYWWTNPIVPEGKGIVRADGENLGTRVVIHE